MTFTSVITLVRQRWRLFVAVVLACTVLAFATALIVPNRWVSSVQLLITAKGSSTAQSYQNMEIETARAISYLALLRSEAVDQRVVDELGLPYSAQTLSGRINAALVPRTTIIDVQVEGDTPDQARLAAESLARQFVAYTAAIEEPTGADGQRVQTTVVGSAAAPTRERPGAWLFGILGALAGVVIGVAAVWVRSKTDPIVRVPADAEAAADGLPILGELGSTDPVEHARALRAKLERLGIDGHVWHAIVVTDECDQTPLSSEFARATAREDERVLVVENEPPRSATRADDLAQVIQGHASLDDVIRNTDDPATDIVSGGASMEDPLDLRSEADSCHILDELRERYGTIVFGTTACELTALPATASAWSDTTILIAVANSTRRRSLASVHTGLKTTGPPAAGIVFVGNRSHVRGHSDSTAEEVADIRPAVSGTSSSTIE